MQEKLVLQFNYCCITGAFGYLEITHDITRFTKAKVFSHINKKTPCFVRFSTVGRKFHILD